MKGRLHSIESFGAVDGPGIRTVFFLQGCPARCIYCHNPDSWDPKSPGEGLFDVEDIVHWALRGKPYHGKEGGVTFSGGEPLMQGKFLMSAIHRLHEEKIHCAVDTSGTYVDSFTKEVMRAADLVLLDIKSPKPEVFREITGISQGLLLELIEIINEQDTPVWVRNVVVPGLNDTAQDIEELQTFMQKINHIENVELLGYHTMALDKYSELGIPYRLKGVPSMDGEKLNKLRALFKKHTDVVSQMTIGKDRK